MFDIIFENIYLKLFFWFFLKHLICDYILQACPWMYKNKGTYGHPGGLVHAFIHFIGTFIVLYFCVPNSLQLAYTLAVFDFIAHYHIDCFKVKIGNYFDLKPTNSEWFWQLLGLDQYLHNLTYLFIIVAMVNPHTPF